MDALEKSNDNTIQQTREGIVVTLGAGPCDLKKINMVGPVLRPLCKITTVAASGLLSADIFNASSHDGVDGDGWVVSRDNVLHDVHNEGQHESVHFFNMTALVRRIGVCCHDLNNIVHRTIVATNAPSPAKATTVNGSDNTAKVDGIFIGLQPNTQNCVIDDTGRNVGGKNSLRVGNDVIGTFIKSVALLGVSRDCVVGEKSIDRDLAVRKLITVFQLKGCVCELGHLHIRYDWDGRLRMICEVIDMTRVLLLGVLTEGKGHGRCFC